MELSHNILSNSIFRYLSFNAFSRSANHCCYVIFCFILLASVSLLFSEDEQFKPLPAMGTYVAVGCNTSKKPISAEGNAHTAAQIYSNTTECFGGNLRSNGSIELAGNAYINGDAIPAPGSSVRIKGNAIVTGATAPANQLLDCSVANLNDLIIWVKQNHRNAQIPSTDKGRLPWCFNNIKGSVAEKDRDNIIPDSDSQWNFCLNENEILHLPAGTYYFTNWTQKKSSKIIADGYVRILLTGTFELKDNASVNADNNPFNLLIFNVTDNNGKSFVNSSSEWKIDSNEIFNGLIYAPGKIAHFSGQAQFQGSIIAQEIQITGQAKLIRWIDESAPVIAFTSPQASCSKSTNLQASFTAADSESGIDPQGISLSLNANLIPIAASPVDPFWHSVNVTSSLSGLSEGTYQLIATAENRTNASSQSTRNFIIDLTAPSLDILSPTDGQIVNVSEITVSGTVSDNYSASCGLSLFVKGTSVQIQPNGTWVTTVQLQPGMNTITAQAFDGAGNFSERTITVIYQQSTACAPPDPSTIAPPLDLTIATDLLTASEFLYASDNPIQKNVAAGIIDRNQVAVLRGKVITRDGNPLPCVHISILDHPEFGYTLTRIDGMFDLVVNGGGSITVRYQKDDYLISQRKINPPWQDYSYLPEVIMVPFDSQVTSIDLNLDIPIQVARGRIVSDSDGSRQATIFFKQGTAAEMVLSDGTIMPINMLSVRATEYTVGQSGPKAMPDELPPFSGYTYAVELNADEAVQANAKTIRFSQPVILYVENYLNFPVGGKVPVGYYDKDKSAWTSTKNGLVLKILNITNNLAELDIDGSNIPADETALQALGINHAERYQLASLYQIGQALWRVSIMHFSPVDCNWPYGPPIDAEPPHQPPPTTGKEVEDPCLESGSIIECQNQTLGQTIGITGTPLTLTYKSDRVKGMTHSRDAEIHLSGPSIPASLKSIELEIHIAGQSFWQLFPASPNLSYIFRWNGTDGYGRLLQGAQKLLVSIGYHYDMIYYQNPADLYQSFNRLSYGLSYAMDRPVELTVWRSYRPVILDNNDLYLGNWNALEEGLGGWSLDIHHAYDPNRKILYLGNGDTRRLTGLLNIIIKGKAGSGWWGYSGDGGPASEASMRNPSSVAIASDGSYYIADKGNLCIRKVDTNGIIDVVAGICGPPPTLATGNIFNDPLKIFQECGQDGPAKEVQMLYPQSIAIGPDGDLYIADTECHRIRHLTKEGFLVTVAGIGIEGFSGDGGLATQAQLSYPYSITISNDGTLFISDSGNYRIRQVGTDGIITTIAGNGNCAYSGDSGLAIQAELCPGNIELSPDGSLNIADKYSSRIRRIATNGIIDTIVGTGEYGYSGDGGLATEAQISWAEGMTFGPDGSLYIADTGNNSIRRISSNGIITTISGNSLATDNGDNMPPMRAGLDNPMDVTISPDSSFIITSNNRIREIQPNKPFSYISKFGIASEDGNEVYLFDAQGRHAETLNSLTGSIKYIFSYNNKGKLAEVIDAYNNVTRIERNSNGDPSSIISPYGQRTSFTLDSNGYLAGIINPANETTLLGYTTDGLLTSLTDPKGYLYNYSYDQLGYLIKDKDPAGGYTNLSRIDSENGYEITLTSALGRTKKYLIEILADNIQHRLNRDESSLITEGFYGTDYTTSVSFPEKDTLFSYEGPDPRFGMQSPLTSKLTISTPSGLTANYSESRNIILEDPNNPLSILSLTDIVNFNDKVYSSIYDASARTLTDTTPEGRQVNILLDENGRVAQFHKPGILPINLSYEVHSLLATIAQGTRILKFKYNPQGFLSTIEDSTNKSVTFQYDDAGRVINEALPDGRIIEYGYDQNGNITSVAPPSRPAHIFNRNTVNLIKEYIAPPLPGISNNITTYSYNEDRQLTHIYRPDSAMIAIGYDETGRRATIEIPQRGTIQYFYYPTTGLLRAINTPYGPSLSFEYDGSLFLKEHWAGIINGTISRVKDNDFKVTSISVNDNAPIEFKYDNDELLHQAGSMTIEHDSQNEMIKNTSLNNATDSYGHNEYGELQNYNVSFNSLPIYDANYQYDNLGRIIQKTETISGETNSYVYAYDTFSRLSDVYQNGNQISHYEYDDNSNRLSVTTPLGTTYGSYDDQDRLIQYGSKKYSYTDNGELLSKIDLSTNETTNYQYDALGNLISVTLSDGTVIEYIYDGVNRRVGKKINGTLIKGFLYYDAYHPIAELDATGNVVSIFIYGTKWHVPDYMIRSGRTYKFITDHLGSVRLVIDSISGEVAQRIDYDEFGKIILDSNPDFQPFGFAGGLYDPQTGLTLFGARDYDAEVGRWTAKDPILFVSGDTNLYGYAMNDPINWLDPFGLQECRKEWKDFFEWVHKYIEKMAKELGIDEDFLLAVSALESGWGGAHDRKLNNPFGQQGTRPSKGNKAYSNIPEAMDDWAKGWGDQIKGAKDIDEFINDIQGRGPKNGKKYNTVDPKWEEKIRNIFKNMKDKKNACGIKCD